MPAADAEERVARLPCWQGPPRIEGTLPGLTNTNLLVRDRAGTWVVRLGTPAPWHGIDRSREAQATRAAAAAGLAPPVLHAGPDALVLARLSGRTLAADELGRPEVLVGVLGLLARCRAMPDAGTGWPADRTPAAILTRYVASLTRRPNRRQHQAGQLAELVAEVAAALVGRPTGFAHNDLHAGNLLESEGRLWLIDWEYAGVSDPLIDLASLSNNGAGEARALLAEVLEVEMGRRAGSNPDAAAPLMPVDSPAFDWMRLAAALRDLLWGYTQDAFGPGGSLEDYLQINRERVARAAARVHSRFPLAQR